MDDTTASVFVLIGMVGLMALLWHFVFDAPAQPRCWACRDTGFVKEYFGTDEWEEDAPCPNCDRGLSATR